MYDLCDLDTDTRQYWTIRAARLLSTQELRVFHLLARGDDVDAIGEELRLSRKAVYTTRYRIREKMRGEL